MSNLRIKQANAADSRTIKVRFNANLRPDLVPANVYVESITDGVPDAKVMSLSVRGNILVINVLPLTPYVKYNVIFSSTPDVRFNDQQGVAFLLEDGRSNVIEVLGAENPTNMIRDNLALNLKDNIYNLDRGTLVRTVLNLISDNMMQVLHDIRQTKNENFLSFTIMDERKIRGYGPWDRLDEEGAYEIIRVGLEPEDATLSGSLSYSSFPSEIITLQSDSAEETLVAGSSGADGTFDRLVLSLGNDPVIKVLSVTINYQEGNSLEYSIWSYGYQINNPRYDTQFASTLLTLEENQVKLNEDAFTTQRIPAAGDSVTISYEYKSLGRNIQTNSVTVTQVLDATRETVGPLYTEFTLSHYPIVTAQDTIATSNGVQFLDPSSATPFLTTHPAFITELAFELGSLPKYPGEYCIDYSTGRVFVYGAVSNDGSGNFPPAATYKYRNTFVSGLDYTYYPDEYELVASPLRELATEEAKISFEYEQVLLPDVDYRAHVHAESNDERIGNKLTASNAIRVDNYPVTDVFRIFNETTGEVYRPGRFNGNTIYFDSTIPPKVDTQTRERAVFASQLNELLVPQEIFNSYSVRIYRLSLLNTNIISATEDVIGAFYNTSVNFSRADIFEQEIYYDSYFFTVLQNINRLSIGQYQIDYRNGIIYVAVDALQNQDVGTVSYRKPVIEPRNSHVISVSEIYHSLGPNQGINKQLDYSSFDDGEITPSEFDVSDERFLNGDTTAPYIVDNGTITVTDDIKAIRHIYDVYDLNNNVNPTDFGESATFSANIITLDPNGVEKREILTIGPGLTITTTYLSPGIELASVSSAIRISDGYQCLDGYETISGNVITLGVSCGANVGDVVNVIYYVALNASATPVVDYDRGEYFIDYTYLADEVLVSYEYGDNVIDFRESETLNVGQNYYVSYRVGALREGLLRNFGSLIDIPEIQEFDTEFDREIYRDCLMGALQSFSKGPTLPSMENLVANVTKITPEIIESIFRVWSLGISRLYLTGFRVNGDPQLVAGKFDQGLLCSNTGESISFPVSSNLRLEEGSLETWIIPEWDGLDNDASLTFTNLCKDGYALSANSIFIGSTSYHPEIVDGTFTLNRNDDIDPSGLPPSIYTHTGIFIYYNTDVKRWYVYAKDLARDGYDGYVYSGSIASSGDVYDVRFVAGISEVTDVLRSGIGTIDFELHLDGYESTATAFDAFSFMADNRHYIFDFAETASKNRFSLYKDGRGYMNFEIWDRGGRYNQRKTRKNVYKVSADIQSWQAGERHHVAMSWALNSSNRQDEMHLFIDGFETPNIMRYGGIPAASSSDRFRTIKPELVVGTIPRNIVVGNDLVTTAGSDMVTSTVNFGTEGILPGDNITIRETGFGTYGILNVYDNVLQLDTAMPITLPDARFSVNEYSAVVSTQVDLFSNIIVSIYDGYTETEIPGLRATIPAYAISKNALQQNILTILGEAKAGDQILIRTLGLNHRRCRERVYMWGDDNSILRTHLPPPINLDETSIRAVLVPYVVIGPENSAIIGNTFSATLADGYELASYQPTNALEGRTLEIRATGGNVNFTTPTVVTINGTSTGGITEVITITEPGYQLSSFKWMTITSIEVVTTPLTTTRTGIGIEIKEAYSVTEANGNLAYAVLRFAYQTQAGLALEGDGSSLVTDNNGFFPMSDVGNLMVITEPPAVAGTYSIQSRIDNNNITINPVPGAAFTGGRYQIYSISIGRSGFQNGFFFLQLAGYTSETYPLPLGVYEFDYATYLEIPFDPINSTAYIGNDFTGECPANAVIDELRIRSQQITDTRIGETIGTNEQSVTRSYQALGPFTKNSSTLVLLHFEELPPVNDTDYYKSATAEYIQSSSSVNDNFGQSIVIQDHGLIFDNKGRLSTVREGSIEFMVSPRLDTYNDPVPRFYFDAAASLAEETISLTKGTVMASGRIGTVLSVRLVTDTNNTGTDYYAGGTVGADFRTINLKIPLPYQRTPVKILYIPSGVGGDRISIYKDYTGYIVFNVRANGEDYQTRQPVFWARDSWHRIRATYKVNSPDNRDEIRLFVDGEERGVIRFGQGLLFGQGFVFGQQAVGVGNQVLIADINFQDTITQFFIGQEYTGAYGAQARLDNFRISDTARGPLSIAGQPIDVNYNTNLSLVYPVIEDAFTTFLLDFDMLSQKTDDFAILRNAQFGIFNFDLNIIDSFDIVLNSEKAQQVLEAMIMALKPANAKVQISYVR